MSYFFHRKNRLSRNRANARLAMRHRLLFRGREHQVPGDPQWRQVIRRPAQRGPLGPVGVGQRPYLRRGDQRHHRHAQPRAPVSLRQGPGPVPQRRVGLLHRPGHDGRRGQRVVLPGEGDAVRGQPLAQDLEGLIEPLLRLRLAGHSVERQLGGGHPAPDAQVEPPGRELVEQHRLLDEAHRVVQRQDRDQRPQPQSRRPPRRRGEHQVRRPADCQRRPVVLGQVIGVEPEPVVGLDQLQPLFDLLHMRPPGVVIVIDDPEAHAATVTRALPSRQPLVPPPGKRDKRRGVE